MAAKVSRLWPAIYQFQYHGAYHYLDPLLYAWKKLHQREFMPVDYLISLPDPLDKTQRMGYSPNWEVTKKLSSILQTPPLHLPIEIDSSTHIHQLYLSHQVNIPINLDFKRIGVISTIMHNESLFEQMGRILRAQGKPWIVNWAMIREPRKD